MDNTTLAILLVGGLTLFVLVFAWAASKLSKGKTPYDNDDEAFPIDLDENDPR